MPFNCLLGMAMVLSFMTHWYYFFIPLALFILNMWFFDRTHRIELLRMRVDFRNQQKTHTHLGLGDHGDTDVWEDKVTGEIVEK